MLNNAGGKVASGLLARLQDILSQVTPVLSKKSSALAKDCPAKVRNISSSLGVRPLTEDASNLFHAKKTVRTPISLLAALVLVNSACAVVNYSPTESVRQRPVETHDKLEFLSFSYVPGSSGNVDNDRRTLPWEGQLVKDLLEHYSRFMKVITTSSPPAMGVHINVYQTDGPPISPWCRASVWTLDVIPCYAEGIIYETHFDVFVDNALKQSYRYEISRKGFTWIGLLPFGWINLFTTQYKEAFSANAYQFVTDATRDGFL